MTYAEKLKDPRWQKKRLEILNRDEWSCRMCGKTERTLHVHHIAYIGENPWDTPDRLLLTTCDLCHSEETEAVKRASYEAIKVLKECGFTSSSFWNLPFLFDKDRGWDFYDPAFSILQMVINDDILWKEMSDLFWKRLAEKTDKNGVKKSF